MITQCSECNCWVTGVAQYFQKYTDFGHSSEEQVNAPLVKTSAVLWFTEYDGPGMGMHHCHL